MTVKPASDEYLAIVTRALAAQTGLRAEDIDPGHGLSTIPGIESVTILRAVAQIEEICSVAIPDDFLFDVATVTDLAKFVADLAGRS